MCKKIGIKYCGGCNPDYDRTGVVEKIGRMLADEAVFVPAGDADADIILAIQGCPTACADLGTFNGKKIVILTGENDIQVFSESDD